MNNSQLIKYIKQLSHQYETLSESHPEELDNLKATLALVMTQAAHCEEIQIRNVAREAIQLIVDGDDYDRLHVLLTFIFEEVELG